MNKRITQYQIILTSCCLLLTSTLAQADRPAMNERSESFESEVIDISTDLEEAPTFEEIPVFEKMTAQDNRPDMQAPSGVNVEPDIQIYDNKTETETTGDVIELQAGDTLPVTVMDFPHRGMSMEKVKSELGRALSVSDAVGDPPITTWTYTDRIVYFEYTHVIHVVAAH